MERSLDEHRQRYEALMAAGVAEYADILAELDKSGLPCHFTQTGGMNAAIEVQLETGETLLVTDAEDSLSWRRSEQLGWGVGLYEAGERAAEGATLFASTEDCSGAALLDLIREVLLPLHDPHRRAPPPLRTTTSRASTDGWCRRRPPCPGV